MALRGLSHFMTFDLESFLEGKRLLFIKATTWEEKDKQNKQSRVLGTKVLVQIWEDKTPYSSPNIDNFGEQLTVKVRELLPEAYTKFKPLSTEVFITDIERAGVYGDYHNQLSIIASVVASGTQ